MGHCRQAGDLSTDPIRSSPIQVSSITSPQNGGTPMAPHPNTSRERPKGPWRMLGWARWRPVAAAARRDAGLGRDELGRDGFHRLRGDAARRRRVVRVSLAGSRDLAFRLGAGVALLAGFLLVWINLAVGIIGSEDNPANLLYSRFWRSASSAARCRALRAPEMARILFAMAVAQGLVGAAALLLCWGADAPSFPRCDQSCLTCFSPGAAGSAAAGLVRGRRRGRGEVASRVGVNRIRTSAHPSLQGRGDAVAAGVGCSPQASSRPGRAGCASRNTPPSILP
jgi:hypothetical protein